MNYTHHIITKIFTTIFLSLLVGYIGFIRDFDNAFIILLTAFIHNLYTVKKTKATKLHMSYFALILLFISSICFIIRDRISFDFIHNYYIALIIASLISGFICYLYSLEE